jgi:hypothetical protein
MSKECTYVARHSLMLLLRSLPEGCFFSLVQFGAKVVREEFKGQESQNGIMRHNEENLEWLE